MYEKRLREQRTAVPEYAWVAPAVLYGFIACVTEAFVLNWLITGNRLNGMASNLPAVVGLLFLGALIVLSRSEVRSFDNGRIALCVLGTLTFLLEAVWMLRLGS